MELTPEFKQMIFDIANLAYTRADWKIKFGELEFQYEIKGKDYKDYKTTSTRSLKTKNWKISWKHKFGLKAATIFSEPTPNQFNKMLTDLTFVKLHGYDVPRKG